MLSFCLFQSARAGSLRDEVTADQTEAAVNWGLVQGALGKQGQMMQGRVFAFTLGREDFVAYAEGVRLLPSFAMSAEIYFKHMGNTTMVMGEIPLRQTEINPTVSRLFSRGLMVTAIHNHRIEMSPQVMWIHFMGQGRAANLAAAVRYALPAGGAHFSSGASPAATSILRAGQLQQILGGQTRVDEGGVITVAIQRRDQIRMNGRVIPPAMGVEQEIYFQPLGGTRAAVTGELPLLAAEVNPVAQTLRQRGIQVTALHNHMLTEQPRLFYLHSWATGDAYALARSLRAALDRSNTGRS
ncbi:MAG: DUF1259 domain-containing protein [Chloroflexi bacterium]|nr:DUF1259 domain-containing protein [Chloroflexota bacterium]